MRLIVPEQLYVIPLQNYNGNWIKTGNFAKPSKYYVYYKMNKLKAKLTMTRIRCRKCICFHKDPFNASLQRRRYLNSVCFQKVTLDVTDTWRLIILKQRLGYFYFFFFSFLSASLEKARYLKFLHHEVKKCLPLNKVVEFCLIGFLFLADVQISSWGNNFS